MRGDRGGAEFGDEESAEMRRWDQIGPRAWSVVDIDVALRKPVGNHDGEALATMMGVTG